MYANKPKLTTLFLVLANHVRNMRMNNNNGSSLSSHIVIVLFMDCNYSNFFANTDERAIKPDLSNIHEYISI